MTEKETKPLHPQRCETCTNVTREHHGCEYFYICNITGDRIWATIAMFTAKVGCASHSNEKKQLKNDNDMVSVYKDAASTHRSPRGVT